MTDLLNAAWTSEDKAIRVTVHFIWDTLLASRSGELHSRCHWDRASKGPVAELEISAYAFDWTRDIVPHLAAFSVAESGHDKAVEQN